MGEKTNEWMIKHRDWEEVSGKEMLPIYMHKLDSVRYDSNHYSAAPLMPEI